MALSLEQLRDLPSPYYRVATRAIILDDAARILVAQNHDDQYELPGGGWEYGEAFEACLQREIREELGVEPENVGRDVLCMYRARGERGVMYLRIAVRATLRSYDFRPVDMKRVLWATRDEFMALDFRPAGEEPIKDFAEQIWAA